MPSKNSRLGIRVLRIKAVTLDAMKCAFPLCDEFYIPDGDHQEFCSEYYRNCYGPHYYYQLYLPPALACILRCLRISARWKR